MILIFFGLFCFIFLSACFSGFESGIIAINGAKLDVRIKQGNKSAKILKFFLDKPDQMLSLILLGNNACTVLTAVLAIELSNYFPSYEYKHTVVALFTTLVLLIFAEILPKLWFRQKPLERSLFLAYLMLFFDKLTSFLTYRIARLIQMLHKTKELTKQEKDNVKQQKREDFIYLLNESLKHNNISSDVANLLKGSLEFYSLRAKSLMTPLKDVISISVDTPIVEVIKLSNSKQISRFPVYKEGKGDWIGVLSIYDAIFYFEAVDWDTLKVHNLMRSLPVINEELTSDEILLEIQKESQPLLAVNDINSRAVGIISSADVIRPLLGEIA